MKYLDNPTTEKAVKFLGKESIFCVMKGILKKPIKDVNGNGETYFKFNLRVTGKEGYNQTYNCIIPANHATNFTEEEITKLKDKEIIIIPSLLNQINEWESEESGKKGINNRLTVYVTRIAVIGEGESNRKYDDTLAVNW